MIGETTAPPGDTQGSALRTQVSGRARELNERLEGKVLYSDGWANDFVWLSKLYDEAGLTVRFRLENLRSLLNDAEAARGHH